MVPPSDKNENCVVQLKEQSLMKKGGVPASERDKNLIKKQTYKHHVSAPTAEARCTIFPKLCMKIQLVGAIETVTCHFFDIAHSLSHKCTENFGLMDERAVSQQ